MLLVIFLILMSLLLFILVFSSVINMPMLPFFSNNTNYNTSSYYLNW